MATTDHLWLRTYDNRYYLYDHGLPITAYCHLLRISLNKHLTLSASVNQVVSYWLLPLLTETTEHEDQGMIATLLALPWFPIQPHF